MSTSTVFKPERHSKVYWAFSERVAGMVQSGDEHETRRVGIAEAGGDVFPV